MRVAGPVDNNPPGSHRPTGCGSRYYMAGEKIGAGSFGAVYKGVDMLTGETVAVKSVVPGRRSTSTEIAVLASLPPHPSVVRLRRVIERGEKENRVVLLVLDYLEIDLKKFILLKKQLAGFIEIKKVVKKILEGVKFLHENGVVHRDIKPENILVNFNVSQLKICDFGLSLQLKQGTSLSSTSPSVGTLSYMAPEILGDEKRYSSAVDMWAVGCILAELVLKEPIYQGKSTADLLACIHAHWNWIRFRQMLGASGFDLLQRLLDHDPEKRITAQYALDHRWFKECYGLLVDTNILPRY